jgi:hemerythrin
MAVATLTEDYRVNVRVLDEEHARLFAMINETHDAVSAGASVIAKQRALSRLMEAMRAHFADEERLVAAHGYPQTALHKLQHDYVLRQLTDLERRLRDDETALSPGFTAFLRDWLGGHIVGTDKKCGAFLNAHGVV